MKLLAVTLALAMVLLAGCTKSGPVTPTQDEQGRYQIYMTASNRFSPANAEIPANATVVFINKAGVHDVTAHDGSWSSDDAVGGLGHKMQPGEVYERRFTAVGDVDYHCELHATQGMKGTLHVGDH